MEPGRLIPLILIGLFYIANAYFKQQKKKEEENRRGTIVTTEEPTEPSEREQSQKPVESLQEVLRRLSEQSRQEQQKKKQKEQPRPKPVPQPTQAKKLEPRVAPVMTSRIVENVKDENETHAYDSPIFEHTDSSVITNPVEVQVQNFDIRQALISSIILNRPEY